MAEEEEPVSPKSIRRLSSLATVAVDAFFGFLETFFASAAAAAADPKQDDVKPVIFIGLFIATLFTMGIVHCL